MRFLLYLVWAALSLLVAVLVISTLGLTVFHDEIEAKLVQKIEQNTGRNVDIEGGISFRFKPLPTFIAKDIKMANAPWGSQPWMLKIETLEVSLSPKDLLHGEFSLSSINIVQPYMLLEQQAHTKESNWAFEKNNEPKVFKQMADRLKIKRVTIKTAEFDIRLGNLPHRIFFEQIKARSDYFSKLIDITAKGRVHGKDITLKGSLNQLRTILLREPSRLALSGQYGKTTLSVKGVVQDLMGWQGHKISLNLETPSLDALQDWLPSKLVQTPEIKASAQFVQPEKWQSARLDDITVRSDGLSGNTHLKGHIQSLKDLSGIHLEGAANYPLKALLAWKGMKSDTDAIVEAQFIIAGNQKEALSLKLNTFELSGQGVHITGQGEIENILAPTSKGIPFKAKAESLASIARLIGQKWPESEAITAQFELLRKQGGLSLDKLALSALNGAVTLSGSIDQFGVNQSGDLKLKAVIKTQDLKQFNALNDLKIPLFESAILNANIKARASKISAPTFNADITQGNATLKLNGAVTELKSLNLSAVNLSLDAPDITSINQLFALKLPDLGTIKATGELKGNLDKTFSINNLILNIDNLHQSTNGKGNVLQLGKSMQANIDLSAKVRSVENLPALFNASIKIPGEIPGNAHALLHSSAANDWSVTDISFDLEGDNQGEITGSILHFPIQPEIDIHVDLKRVSLASLPNHALLDAVKPKNVNARFRLSNLAKKADVTAKTSINKLTLDELDAQFNMEAGEVSVKLTGKIDDISKLEGIDLSIASSTSDLKSVSFLKESSFKDDLALFSSLNLKGNLDALTIQLHQAQIEDSEVKGSIRIENLRNKKEKPLFKGEFQSNNLDILSLLQKSKRTRLFSKEVFDFDFLTKFNADIQLKVQRFNGVIAALENVKIHATVQDGILHLPNMHGQVGVGRLTTWLIIDANKKPYNIVSSMIGEQIKPEHINLFGESQLIQGGEIEINIGLAGSGTSMAHFMDHAYGKIQIELNNSSIKNQNLELFGQDLILGVLKVINPLDNQQDYLPIECGVIHFPVVNGDAVASQGIAIKTRRVTVLGGGTMNLGTERLDILIKPKARKGIGLSAGTLVNIAKISGQFDDAKVSIDAKSVLQSTAAIGVAIATGGWSLLAQGLIDRAKANSDVCQQTLDSPNTASLLTRIETETNTTFLDEQDTER